jgi:hypothetical protein
MQDFPSNIYIIPTETGKSVKVCFEQELISEKEAVEKFTFLIDKIKAMNEPENLKEN